MPEERQVTKQPKRERPSRQRTCVGCGKHDHVSALLRLVDAGAAGGGEESGHGVAFDLAGGAFGRGAHVHPRRDCLAKAPRGIARAFGRAPVPAVELGRMLVSACDRSLAGLLVTARRLRAVAVGIDAALGGPPLLVVAVDAGVVASRREVERAIAEGRAVAWKQKGELGGLLGEGEVALCAVRHEGIAAKFKWLRAAADAGAAMMGEGEGCSPEGR